MYTRILARPLLDALSDTPVVLINGARQTGKTTLAQSVSQDKDARAYVNLDDAGVLSAAKGDPVGFIAGQNGPVIIDEVQRAPELFPAIKVSVDRNRQSGRFLLTGSANVLLLPRLSESLAGRMEILTLWPLSQSEIAGRETNIIDSLFGERIMVSGMPEFSREALLSMLIEGGYPEPHARASAARRRAGFSSYVTTVLQRDVRDIASIDGLITLPRLVYLLASRTSSLLNLSDVSRTIDIPYATLSRYMNLLQATYLVHLLPPWSSNLGARLVKSPKVLLNDTGLIAGILALNPTRLAQDGVLLGGLLETFIATELLKQLGGSSTQASLFHYRTLTGHEVDLLLEDAGGRLVAIEVKASSTVTSSDFKGIRALQQAAEGRFHRGVILYAGRDVIPFGENLHAVPLTALWH